jgi:hypothetical protein
VLFAAAAATIGLVAVTQVAPAHSARERALDLFVEGSGAACVGGADIYLNLEQIDKRIAASLPNAGWIVDDLLFVGTLDQAIASMDGVLSASDQSAAWVQAQKDGPALMRLEQRVVEGVTAYVVRESYTVC